MRLYVSLININPSGVTYPAHSFTDQGHLSQCENGFAVPIGSTILGSGQGRLDGRGIIHHWLRAARRRSGTARACSDCGLMSGR